MLSFLFLFGLALGAMSPSDGRDLKLRRGSCPAFWYSFNNRCYKYVATHTTWADAEIQCVSQGANLVSIHSQDEHDFVTFLIQNFDPAQGWTWFGLSDLHKDGSWMWSDGCPLNFTLWEHGQPNGAAAQNCGQLNFFPGWNDYECVTHSPSVCATRISC